MAVDLGLGAIVGYALGTAQIIVLSWLGDRAAHRRHLRQLRSDLRRLAAYKAEFGWIPGVVPDSDGTPNPPAVSGAFVALCQQTDFWLTDETKDDNSLEALLSLPDGCVLLERHSIRVHELIEGAQSAVSGEERAKLIERAMLQSQEYDKVLGTFMRSVNSAIADVDRRIREASRWRQVRRALRALPNPPQSPLRGDA